MQQMNDMPMMWHPMPGQTWLGTSIMFVAMWTVMMVAMMLPSLVPVFVHYRVANANGSKARAAMLGCLVLIGYSAIWMTLGIAMFPVGVALEFLKTQHSIITVAMPMAVALIVLMAGALQFTKWKAQQLTCWHGAVQQHALSLQTARSGLRLGLQLGMHCVYCSAGLTAMLTVVGISNTALMIAMTVAVSFERLSRNSLRVTRVVGAVVLAAGGCLFVQAIGT